MFNTSNTLTPIQPTGCDGNQILQAKLSANASGSLPKLRLSCEPCGAAKIKCSKERPRCERCVSNGLICSYKPSLHHGKPKRRTNFEDQNTPNFEANGITIPHRPYKPVPGEPDYYGDLERSFTDLVQNVGGADGMHGTHQGASNIRDDISESMFSMSSLSTFDGPIPHDVTMTSYADNSARGGSNDNTSGSNTSHALFSPYDCSVSWSSNVDLAGTVHPNASINPPKVTPSSTSQSDVSTRKSSKHESFHIKTHDCYAVANSTLAILLFKSNPSSRESSVQLLSAGSPASIFANSSSPVQTYEDLFRINQEAISNVSQLLDCQCAGNPHMAMLYASIIVKVLYWYQVAAGMRCLAACSYGSSNSMNASAGPCSNSVPQFENTSAVAQSTQDQRLTDEAFATQEPFRIGTYTPDEEDQERIRRLLLLSNLRKVGRLIEALARIGNRVDEGASNLYRTLGVWLKSELDRTIKEGAASVEGVAPPGVGTGSR